MTVFREPEVSGGGVVISATARGGKENAAITAQTAVAAGRLIVLMPLKRSDFYSPAKSLKSYVLRQFYVSHLCDMRDNTGENIFHYAAHFPCVTMRPVRRRTARSDRKKGGSARQRSSQLRASLAISAALC